MNKAFILLVSITLFGTNSVVAMDNDEIDPEVRALLGSDLCRQITDYKVGPEYNEAYYNEAYRMLPTLNIQRIEHQLSEEDIKTLLKITNRKASGRFKTADGQVYEINQTERPALKYLMRSSPSDGLNEPMITWLTVRYNHNIERNDNTGTICHKYASTSAVALEDYYRYLPRNHHTEELREFETTGLNFKKVNLQEYRDWGYNLTPEERALFPTIYPPEQGTPGPDAPKQHVPAEDDWLKSCVELAPQPLSLLEQVMSTLVSWRS